MCRVDKFGFPRAKAKAQKRVCGFQTGDLVKAIVPKGKRKGLDKGRVVVRTSGYFDIQTPAGKRTLSHKYINLIQRSDGYGYSP